MISNSVKTASCACCSACMWSPIASDHNGVDGSALQVQFGKCISTINWIT